MAVRITPVILCGGSGRRLWPLSRRDVPKQLIALGDGPSPLQQTLRRLKPGPRAAGIIYAAPSVIASAEIRFAIAAQAAEEDISLGCLALEPMGRDTAAAAAIGARLAAEADPDGICLLCPSDHQITDESAFETALAVAAHAAAEGAIAMVGIAPSHPSTGYGYIQKGAALGAGAFRCIAFREKPDLETAQRLLQDGGWYWNSGMFLARPDRLWAAIAAHQPGVAAAVDKALQGAQEDLDFLRLDEEAFKAAPKISFDYGVMEHLSDAVMVPGTFAWSDVGTWPSVHAVCEKDAAGNAVFGDAVLENVEKSLIRADRRLLVAKDLRNIAVIDTPDAILVSSLDTAVDLKALVGRLEAEQRQEATRHLSERRPWGGFEIITKGPGFSVKRLWVDPGEGLSLQYHNQRSEHWVVVSGMAAVTLNEEAHHLGVGQSIDIAPGTAHRLENKTNRLLEIIEVQIGAYLGEDDIVRLEDRYGRKGRISR